MKLLKFPIVTHVIKAICDCGGELSYTGFSTAGNPQMHTHVCKSCGTPVLLKYIYPKHIHEQSSDIGDEVSE